MRKLLLRVTLIAFCVAGVGAQVQVKRSPDAINISNDAGHRQAVAITLEHPKGLYPFLGCDSAAVLLDVLNNIADPAFVKQEIAYEEKNKLDSSATYDRRLGLIKVLAEKTVKK